MPETALDLALRLAAVGWHVFPLSPRDKRPLANCAACRARHGHPAHPIADCPCLPAGRWCHGVRAATVDPHRLTAWFTAQPTAAVGVAAGPSGLALVDIDTHATAPPRDPARELLPGIDLTREPRAPDGWQVPDRYRDGRDTLRLLAQLRGGPRPWPVGPEHRPVTADTPSGGRHLWYRAPAPNLHQAVPPKPLGWQVDLKAGWSYGLAPGTVATTGTYTHTGGDPASVGTPPPWLAREIIRAGTAPPPPRTPPAPVRPGRGPASYVFTLIERGAAAFAHADDGRKAALAALAYKTGGFLAWAALTEADVIDPLIAAGTACGLAYTVAERTARRSLANGQRRPIAPLTSD